MGEYSKAEKIYKQLWAMKPEGDKRFEILLDRGWLYFSEGNYKEAERNYKKALSISTKLKKEYLPGKLYYNLGILEKERENYRKAEGYANKALSIGKKYRNNFYITASLNLLAIIEQGKNNYKKAISYYKETAKLLKKEKNVLRLLNVLVNFSKCYYYSGNIKVCEKNIMESLDLAKKLGKPYEIAYLFNLYGYLMVKKGEFQKAEDYFIRSLNISLSIENYPVQFDNLTELALLSIVQGKDKHIKEYIEKAIKLKKKIKNKRELMKIDLVKEIREYTLGNYKKTIRYAQPIVKTVGDLHIPFYQIPALVYQGLALSKLNKNREATESIKVADNLRKQFGLNLYRYDIKFAKIEIGKQKNNQALINKVSKLLKNRKVKRQAFLYARVLMFFAEIKRKEFRKRRLREPFIESIDSLKKAKELFKKINAKLYIEKVNRKMVDVIDDYTPLERMEKRSEQYLNILEELGDTIGSIDNPEILKKKFITLAKKITGAERGLFLSFIPDENDFVITGKNIDEATIIDARRISRSMVNKAVETKKPVICYDALNDRKFRNNESVMVNEIRSLLCVPIIAEDRVFGTLYLDSRKRPGLFSEKDKEFFNSLSKILSDSLMKAFEFKNIEEETMRLRKRIRTSFGPRSIIGASPKMQEVYGRIEKAASVDIPILILGETGTGKELVANTIHELSSRQDKPFTVVDCLSIPPTLLESELFGYIKGAFTGADREKDGLLESSKEGTIFIDEVGDAILAVQSNLLRFLDTGQIKKIGSTKYKKVDTRVIVATNKNLEKLVEEGNFREDLYYRLKKFVIKLPPLREKKEDIRLLAEHYIKIFNRKYNKNIKGITKDGFEMFYKYDWPGNIREFENEIEMAVISCNRSMIEKNVLSPKISRLKTGFISLREAEALARYNHIRKVLEFTEGNVTRAAEILKIDRKTIQRIMKNHK
jgi:transcriptional regulator with GAF, ATPase, and Fis domain/Tfp pilus assembly protein PilF